MSALHRMTTVDEVEATLGQPPSMIMLKQICVLDEGCRTVLAYCPLAGFGYRDAGGVSRTTFIGGTPGFVRVHSNTRMSFTLPDGEAHGPVSFVFLLPGVGEELRVNGSVAKRKGSETFVDVEEAYVHCAQAVLRARLWQPPVPAEPAPEVQGEGPLRGPGVADFLAAAPFLALSTWDGSGGSDTSPRGDRRTVARILDGRTLVIPDRRGNKRADSLHNLLQDNRLSFAALVPGRTGVLHVRFGLQEEGYEDVEVGSPRTGRRKRPAAEPAAVNRLREVRIAEVRRETSSAVTLVLEDAERPSSFDFRPGQFFTLVSDVDGRPVRRAYSASSAPGASRLEVTVKQVEGGRFSTHVHRDLRRAADAVLVHGRQLR